MLEVKDRGEVNAAQGAYFCRLGRALAGATAAGKLRGTQLVCRQRSSSSITNCTAYTQVTRYKGCDRAGRLRSCVVDVRTHFDFSPVIVARRGSASASAKRSLQAMRQRQHTRNSHADPSTSQLKPGYGSYWATASLDHLDLAFVGTGACKASMPITPGPFSAQLSANFA